MVVPLYLKMGFMVLLLAASCASFSGRAEHPGREPSHTTNILSYVLCIYAKNLRP